MALPEKLWLTLDESQVHITMAVFQHKPFTKDDTRNMFFNHKYVIGPVFVFRKCLCNDGSYVLGDSIVDVDLVRNLVRVVKEHNAFPPWTDELLASFYPDPTDLTSPWVIR